MMLGPICRPDKDSFLQCSGKIVAIALFIWITATRVSFHKNGVVASGDDAYSASLGTIIWFGFKRTALTAGLCRIIFKVERVTTATMRKLTQTNMGNIVSIMIFWNA
ncbi:MAG TPA: hypothetical protein VFW53_10550 [Gallionella sp.]|nr:hypothetical protein [Gallionella sp.]